MDLPDSLRNAEREASTLSTCLGELRTVKDGRVYERHGDVFFRADAREVAERQAKVRRVRSLDVTLHRL